MGSKEAFQTCPVCKKSSVPVRGGHLVYHSREIRTDYGTRADTCPGSGRSV